MTYTLTVTNNGPDPSSGGSVVDTLPANVTFVSASPGCVNAAGTVTCPVGSLASGASQVLVIVTATAPGTATNTATVTANDVDDHQGNNTATVTSRILPKQSDLSITKTGPSLAQSGNTITYSIAVSNSGPAADPNVR
jgi:conserved repeat domain